MADETLECCCILRPSKCSKALSDRRLIASWSVRCGTPRWPTPEGGGRIFKTPQILPSSRVRIRKLVAAVADMTSPLYRRYIPVANHVSQSVSEKTDHANTGPKKRKRAEISDVQSKNAARSSKTRELQSSTHIPEYLETKQISAETVTQRKTKKGGRGETDDGPAIHDLNNNRPSSEKGFNAKPKGKSRLENKSKHRKLRQQNEDDVVDSSVADIEGSSNTYVEKQLESNGPDLAYGDHNEYQDKDETFNDGFHGKDSVVHTKHKSIRSKFERSSEFANTHANEESAELESDGGRAENNVEVHDLVPLPQPDPVQQHTTKPSFSALPPWLANPIIVSPKQNRLFEDLQVNTKVLSAFKTKGYTETFAVQSAVLLLLLPGVGQHAGDVCISAATGSGKTLAYMLPMVESLRSRTVIKLRGLIVVPTRELVAQAREVCDLCATGSGLKIGTAVGNKSLKEEQELLVRKGQRYDTLRYRPLQTKSFVEGLDFSSDPFNLEDIHKTLPGHVEDYNSNIDILICTPGRLVDHMRSTRGFTLDHVQWLVIDEADRLLNQSFQEWVGTVMNALEGEKPYNQLSIRQRLLLDMGYPREERVIRKIVLSATMTKDIGKLSALKLRRPKLVLVDNAVGNVARDLDDELRPESGGVVSDSMKEHEGYDLPPTLHEKALAVGDGHDKPLYLLELLKGHLSIFRYGSLKDTSPLVEGGFPTAWSHVTSATGENNQDLISHVSSTISTSSSAEGHSTSSSASESSKAATTSSQHLQPALDPGKYKSSNHGVLIFTNNNENALRLARLLSILHPPYHNEIRTLTKSTSTSSSRQALSAFHARKVSILIASDRASRGLDVPDLGNVINYDIPTSVTGYVHRVGRTARAGKPGQAWTLTTHSEARWFWNEIARGGQIRRGRGRKVERAKIDIDVLSDEAKTVYAEALSRLGEEAQGKINHR
ncbi:MAG: ATP-dependent RNA helicase dbp6 [Pleopsidium flavum]|nr:MAG: ATP-dependent RNA helicase dbp6 [Pleopsidium flavum]